MNPQRMTIYSGLCGWALARAHARTGDPVAIASYLGKSDRFDQAIADYAELYADQNEADHKAVLAAQRAGELEVERSL
jgi:NAD(P)H-dependent flavin oxidoreductase YrpB (nitropropane dioxygenase family)